MIDIDSMGAGQEMDVLIGELLSFNKIDINPTDVPYKESGLRHALYSTDISVAWNVVQRMNKDRWFFSVLYDPRFNGGWRCIFEKLDSGSGYVSADTAPLAICRAAYKALSR